MASYESKNVCSPTGTKYFMAPDGSRLFCQKKFDMWACGVTMYLLFTGRLPPQIEKLQKDFETSRCMRISSDAKDLILKLLNTDPHSRITA
jgi:serine/threonine protein kinase